MCLEDETTPGPAGPYTPVVNAGNFIMVSGQRPVVDGQVPDTFGEQAHAVLRNLRSQLSSAGVSMRDVVKVNVFLADLADFEELNEIYVQHFSMPYPARTTVGARLRGILVEVDAIAYAQGSQRDRVHARGRPSTMTGDITVIQSVRLPLGRSDEAPSDVHVERDRIRKVVRTGTMPIPRSARLIDGAGKFLIPGLIDAHVHFPARSNRLSRDLALLYVVNGITSVYCMSGSRRILELRDEISRGVTLGPTIYSSSPIQNDPAITFEAGRGRVRRYGKAGYDSIKVYNLLTRGAFDGICFQAHRMKMPVIGHIVRSVGALETLRSYQSAVVHAEEFLYTHFDFSNRATDEAEDRKLRRAELPRLAQLAAANGVLLVATLQTYRSIIGQFEDIEGWLARPEMRYLPRPIRDQWAPDRNRYATQPYVALRLRHGFAFQLELVAAFHAAGVPVLAGTDALVTGVAPGFTLREEVTNLTEAGLSKRDAILAATAAVGGLVGDRLVGRLDQGCWADLLLLDGDPTLELENLGRIHGVMRRGQYLDRASISAALNHLGRANAQPPTRGRQVGDGWLVPGPSKRSRAASQA